jgi:acyl-CoA synthetase (AMP-forming)/AMP-acid ligase II
VTLAVGSGYDQGMEFNLADLFEYAVDLFPEREYLVADGRRRTYTEMDERANRLAHHLADQGVGPGDHVGIYGQNSVEWVEALWAVFKLRAVWININYRYVADELAYLVGNADLVALLHQEQYGDRVDSVRDALPKLRHTLVMDTPEYDEALAAQSSERDFGPRSPDDRYILYTGGTTGLPKGVVWRHEDVFYALGGGIEPYSGHRMTTPNELGDKAKASDFSMTFFPLAPLMHGATQWAVMGQSFGGNKVVLCSRFDADATWRTIAAERVTSMMITGDAMGRPLVEALDVPGADYDVSSLFSLSSSAATFSPVVKDRFFVHFPDLIMVDAVGSSEGGNNGMTVVDKANTAMAGGPSVSPLGGSVVLDDDLRVVEPGSGVIGKVARSGDIPLGYYNDPVKTAEVFFEVDGTRYVMPGDHARVEADGSITLLGRGSVSINSGGEKIFPEEVETACKSHPSVWDATVIGVPDERWGQRVAAIVALRQGDGIALTLEDLQEHCRTKIAGYKVPRQLHVVGEVVRSPSGKPDYRWAASVATADD